ncbi:acyl carrier protein [Desulfovibrio sp. JC022]|uniref:acyl carrier protein n=1 Tax=Desulfovibrio sp. JC022 TaxID=2593642 RepID=UPI0013D4B654|nr:phosphopantetheine-binding protein [Desulfovibrio sp. JC022]NDV22203.1 hypothetical protein [Desulfovibrio sp. JC022]
MLTETESFVIEQLEKVKEIPASSDEEKKNFNFIDEGHIDSFGIMNLVLTVEDKFNVQLTQDHFQSEEIRTVSGMAKIINDLKG